MSEERSEPAEPSIDRHEEDLAVVREALDDLRREIRLRFGAAADDSQARPGIALDALVDELRRRVSTLGMSERSGEVDEFGMDEVVLRRARRVFDFLYERYWRVDLSGMENVPAGGPCLLVANRSGLLPYDGLLLAHAIERERGGPRPRFTVADWLVTLPFAQPYLARLGGVRACRENVDRLLASGHPVIVFPEGGKGATKVFRERYRLQRFGRGGVIRAALESGVPLVPVGIVGAEEAHPVLFKWFPPGRPVPFVPVTPTFPLLGPLGVLPLPTKWVIRIGAPVELSDLDPASSTDPLLLSRLNEDLRAEIQALVDEGLRSRESVWS